MRAIHLPVLAFIALALGACGVRIGAATPTNPFFRSLEVTGSKLVGQPLTVHVEYAQNYPLQVEIACELRQKGKLVKFIGREAVQAQPEGTPKRTPFLGNFAFDFVVDAPGRYRVECLTPEDEDNFIIDEFTVRDP